MLNRTEMQNRLLSSVLGALAASILVVMASLTHAMVVMAPHA
jgi:hypothetical protein